MGSGGKAGTKVNAAPASIGVAGAGGGHADGPGGVAGGVGGVVDVTAPVTLVSPAPVGLVADLHAGVAKLEAAPTVFSPAAGGVTNFLAAAQPVAQMFGAAYSGDPAYKDLAPEQKDQLWAAAKDAAKGYLESVPKGELQKAAAAAGFQHPMVIGQDDPKGSALAFVLNPFYGSPNAQKTKAKIQAKALAKFQALPPEQQAALAQEEAAMAAAAMAGAGPATGVAADTTPEIPAPSADADQAPGAAAPSEPPKVQLPKLLAHIQTAFNDMLKGLAGLALQRKAAKELPPWRGRQAVAQLVFHREGDAGHLGGVHEKDFYRTPDGTRWLFKPDKKAGGAVAAAEEAATEIARQAGLPAVEVRRVKIGGKVGSIQPLAGDPGALGALPPDPAAWTPQQQAGVMAQHVVDWVVGDHDGNHTNFILFGDKKTPVRIDRGQAFKFLGQDSLDLEYEPNKVHGAPPHAATALYRAAKGGKIQINPMLLSPVIQAIEKIPDQEYRELLRPVAELGAKSKQAAWYQAAWDRAALQKGGKPTEQDVVNAFLDAALARKHGARVAFEGLLSNVLGQPFQFVAAPGKPDGAAALAPKPLPA